MIIDYKQFKQDLAVADQICLFGVGALLQDCYPQIVLLLGREPDCFCDNDQDKWEKQFWGKPCLSPEAVVAQSKQTLVIVTVRNYAAITAQLKTLGLEAIYAVCYERRYHRVEAVRAVAPLSEGEKPLAIEGKWAFVTGSLRGIGRQIALALADRGANLIVHGRKQQQADTFAELCRSNGVEAVPLGADLSDTAEVGHLLERLDQLVPQVDILYNNAGISPALQGNHWDVSSQVYQQVFAVNTLAPIRICNHLLPKMIDHGFGRVVNVSSSIQGRPTEMAYACSKAALDKYIYDIASTLTGTGVMVSAVDPGWLRTDMGGRDAPREVGTVLPGALLGALLDRNVNGCWFTAQDYADLTLEGALAKALFLHPGLA